MMYGHKKSDLVIVAMKPANKAKEAHCGGICEAVAAESVERRAGAKGSTHQHSLSLTDSFRQMGVYTGRILQGEAAADLPVLQPAKFEFVLKVSTAKSLALSIPDRLLAIADEVIE